MTRTPPICFECKHFNRDPDAAMVCRAYPQGIPVKIMDSDFIHKSHYKGDHGIMFEPMEEK